MNYIVYDATFDGSFVGTEYVGAITQDADRMCWRHLNRIVEVYEL